jgi:cell division protein FtsW (lipid II flippase)
VVYLENSWLLPQEGEEDMKNKKQLLISQIILGISAIVAALIMLRPGSDFDVSENWFVFVIIIVVPLVYSTIIIAAAKNKKDDE